MQNLIIEAELVHGHRSAVKLQWYPRPPAPFGSFLLVGAFHTDLGVKLWKAFERQIVEVTGYGSRDEFAEALYGPEYETVGQIAFTPLQSLIATSVVVVVEPTIDNMAGSGIRMTNVYTNEVILENEIDSVTNRVYTPR